MKIHDHSRSNTLAAMRKKLPSGSLYQKKYRDRHGKSCLTTTWHLKYYIKGRSKPVRISSGTNDYQEAVAILRQRMAKATIHPDITHDPDRVRIGQLFDLLIEDYQYNNRESTYDTRTRVDRHLRPYFGQLKAVQFSSSVLKEYVARRKRAGAEQATVNKELAFLRRAFRLGFLHEPKLVAVPPYIPIPKVMNAREGTVSHEQYRALRDLLPSYARTAFVIAYHTGARKGEIRKIRIDAIDFTNERMELRAKTTKNKTARYLPIYGDMAAELEMAIAAADPKCPFLIQDGSKPVFDWEKSWRTACSLAQIPDKLFHDLRRTALTNMMEAGFNEKEAMEISGHKTRSVFMRYQIVPPARMKKLGAQLARHLRSKEEEIIPRPRYAS